MIDAVTKCLGLVKQYNPLQVAPGALVKAQNCVIRRENTLEDRRGYKAYGTVTNNVKQLLTYSSRVLVHHNNKIAYDNGSGTFNDYSGTYSAPSGVKIRGIEAYDNLYFTTDEGLKVITDITGTAARNSGAPRPLDPSYTLTSVSAGFLANGYQTAYRAVIKRIDANNNVLFSYPSQRLWVKNDSGAAENVVLTAYIPSEIAAGDIFQLYRAAQVSGTSSDTSGDELGLVYEYTVTSADVTNGYVSVTDSVTDSLIGATIYTAPSQDGIAQANERPPLCKDVALYKSNFMFFANTETKHRLNFSLVGTSTIGYATTGDTNGTTTVSNVGDTTNVQIGWEITGDDIPAGTTVAGKTSNTITLSQAATGTTAGANLYLVTDETVTIAGTEYTFSITEDSANDVVGVTVTGVASVDIDETARSLVKAINRGNQSNVYAYYDSGPDDLPGQLALEERTIGGSAYTVQVSDSTLSTMIFPEAPVDPATSSDLTSTNSQQKNALYYSKLQQPEAVPVLNYLPVGPANKEILRIVPLRDSLIIIKEEGVYRLTGETASGFVITPLDNTVFCLAADSVAELSNKVFMLSNQGVVSVSEQGVEVVSRDIEPLLVPLTQNSSLSDYTYGFAYDSERSYLLSTITSQNDTVQNRTLVYNTFTNTWVEWTFAFEAGVVEPGADKYYFASPSSTQMYVERKSFTDDDFADPEQSITITAISGDSVTFTSSVEPDDGDVISQGSTKIAIDTVYQVGTEWVATMISTPPASWATGAANLFPHVRFEWIWNSWLGGNPAALKQVRQIAMLTDDIEQFNSATKLRATFTSNFDEAIDEVVLEPPSEGWGTGAWGSFPWGGAADTRGYPTWVPRNKQYCNRMRVGGKHGVALQRLSVSGVAFEYNLVSEEVGR